MQSRQALVAPEGMVRPIADVSIRGDGCRNFVSRGSVSSIDPWNVDPRNVDPRNVDSHSVDTHFLDSSSERRKR
jgi:hypothetical protein